MFCNVKPFAKIFLTHRLAGVEFLQSYLVSVSTESPVANRNISVILQQSSIRNPLGRVSCDGNRSLAWATIERTQFDVCENPRHPPSDDKSAKVTVVPYSAGLIIDAPLVSTACSKFAQPSLRASHFASTLKFDVLQSQLQPRFEANSTRHCPAMLRVPSFHSSPGYI